MAIIDIRNTFLRRAVIIVGTLPLLAFSIVYYGVAGMVEAIKDMRYVHEDIRAAWRGRP